MGVPGAPFAGLGPVLSTTAPPSARLSQLATSSCRVGAWWIILPWPSGAAGVIPAGALAGTCASLATLCPS